MLDQLNQIKENIINIFTTSSTDIKSEDLLAALSFVGNQDGGDSLGDKVEILLTCYLETISPDNSNDTKRLKALIKTLKFIYKKETKKSNVVSKFKKSVSKYVKNSNYPFGSNSPKVVNDSKRITEKSRSLCRFNNTEIYKEDAILPKEIEIKKISKTLIDTKAPITSLLKSENQNEHEKKSERIVKNEEELEVKENSKPQNKISDFVKSFEVNKEVPLVRRKFVNIDKNDDKCMIENASKDVIESMAQCNEIKKAFEEKKDLIFPIIAKLSDDMPQKIRPAVARKPLTRPLVKSNIVLPIGDESSNLSVKLSDSSRTAAEIVKCQPEDIKLHDERNYINQTKMVVDIDKVNLSVVKGTKLEDDGVVSLSIESSKTMDSNEAKKSSLRDTENSNTTVTAFNNSKASEFDERTLEIPLVKLKPVVKNRKDIVKEEKVEITKELNSSIAPKEIKVVPVRPTTRPVPRPTKRESIENKAPINNETDFKRVSKSVVEDPISGPTLFASTVISRALSNKSQYGNVQLDRPASHLQRTSLNKILHDEKSKKDVISADDESKRPRSKSSCARNKSHESIIKKLNLSSLSSSEESLEDSPKVQKTNRLTLLRKTMNKSKVSNRIGKEGKFRSVSKQPSLIEGILKKKIPQSDSDSDDRIVEKPNPKLCPITQTNANSSKSNSTVAQLLNKAKLNLDNSSDDDDSSD